VGHFAPLEDPEGVMDAVDAFIREEAPAEADPLRFRELLQRGG
jgi:hypothetical protein